MTLSKTHRESLLNSLQKSKDSLITLKLCLSKANEDTDHLKEWWEISIFLEEERIKLIEKSLIDNEIDF
jgi:hypothetical protein